MSFFNYQPATSDAPASWSVSSKFWIYWAVALPVTAVTIGMWLWWQRKLPLLDSLPLRRQKASRIQVLDDFEAANRYAYGPPAPNHFWPEPPLHGPPSPRPPPPPPPPPWEPFRSNVSIVMLDRGGVLRLMRCLTASAS